MRESRRQVSALCKNFVPEVDCSLYTIDFTARSVETSFRRSIDNGVTFLRQPDRVTRLL